MSKEQGPTQERAQATQAAILGAAAQAFARHGYAGTSLDVVASSAGVTKGALYFHFESKSSLATALVDAETAITTQAAQATLAEGRPAIETMVRLAKNLTELIVDDVVVEAGIRLTTEEFGPRSTIEQPFAQWTELFAELVTRGVVEGDLRPDIDPEKVARFVVGAWIGLHALSMSKTETKAFDLFDRVREMWEILLPGISTETSLEAARALASIIRR